MQRRSSTAGSRTGTSLQNQQTQPKRTHTMEDNDQHQIVRKSRASRRATTSSAVTLSKNVAESSLNREQSTTFGHICAACTKPIMDRYLLRALEQSWHCGCLVCSLCHGALDELGPTLFVRGDLILCRRDYARMFASGGQCAGCLRRIAPHESVMRARNLAFHPECFSCSRCGYRFRTGDRFCLDNNRPTCEASQTDPSVCATIKSAQGVNRGNFGGGSYNGQAQAQASNSLTQSAVTSHMHRQDTSADSSLFPAFFYHGAQESQSNGLQQGASPRHAGSPALSDLFYPMNASHNEDPSRVTRSAQVH